MTRRDLFNVIETLPVITNQQRKTNGQIKATDDANYSQIIGRAACTSGVYHAVTTPGVEYLHINTRIFLNASIYVICKTRQESERIDLRCNLPVMFHNTCNDSLNLSVVLFTFRM